MQEIILRFSTSGDMSIETKGYSGRTCMKADQFLKDGFGLDSVVSEKKTNEFFMAEVSEEAVGVHN